jgi:peptidoglycan/xylan/chitin deacetylase (PgdA/CDA1 family)
MRLRSVIKEAVYGIVAASGLPPLVGAHRCGLVVLTYHSVGAAEEHPYLNRMPPDRFRDQVRYLKAHYDVVAILDGLDRLASGNALRYGERPMVAITVDDGYADSYDNVFPIACEEGVPIAIFLATDYLDCGRLPWPTRASALIHFATAKRFAIPSRGSLPSYLPIETPEQRQAANRALRDVLSHLDQPERDAALEDLIQDLAPADMRLLPPLTWAQVREMQGAGVVFGSHTHYHAWLDRISAAEVERELGEAKARIEAETGRSCDVIAYPNGNSDGRVRAATARAGYRYALTQERGINTVSLDRLAIRRIEVPYDELLGTFICRTAGFAA